MSNKQFYRETATERQWEYRQRATAVKLDSKLNDLEADFEVFCLHTENDDYQFHNDSYSNVQHVIIETFTANDDETIVDNNNNYDGDNDEDVIRELIGLFDANREQKLYSSCNLSIYNAYMKINKLSRDLNLNKQ
ncbi:unnamed protein product [Adineta steineri]|uniref:Uncharacterized protein n=1 Tax=Adineta steineri TaxID=433720 RepID=A0A815RUA4_9BILA|nr:unnamed protein product [Adineta steineri]CAF4157281.1 unnamed protein product [Adineta steineri]